MLCVFKKKKKVERDREREPRGQTDLQTQRITNLKMLSSILSCIVSPLKFH